MKSALRAFVILAFAIAAGLWFGNTSRFVSGLEAHETRLLAHRGVHQIYVGTDRTITSCQASPIAPVTHGFIENTLPSMREAFRLGADVVEIDVHLTPDGVFAVYHDWTVDCRTNGTGVTEKLDFPALRALDLAYNLDDGTGRFPLRGKGIGLMPSLAEVLNDGMGGHFLINFKSNRAEEGTTLATLLDDPNMSAQVFGVYGGAQPTNAATAALPDLRGFDRSVVKDCLIQYLALGWSGHIPGICGNTMLLIPQNYAPLLWGWPHRFTRRMTGAGTTVILAGDYDGSGFSSGIDDAESYAKVPAHFDGYI